MQALHYCTDQSLVATDYVAVWALTGLLGGAAVGSAALFWINALACVGGAKDRVLPWNGFVVVECGLVASPLVVGILVIFVLVKGVVACVGKWTEFFRGGGNNGETRARGTAGDGAEEGELGDMESGNLSRAETEVALETFDKGGS